MINSKSRIVTGVYRPPKGDIKVFKNYCKDFLKKKSASSKIVFMVGDLNIFSKWIFASYTEGYESNENNSNCN